VPKVAKNLSFRCLHLIGENKRTKLGATVSLREWLVHSYAARLFGNTFLNFVSNFSPEGSNWLVCLWQHYVSKMGYFKCTILLNVCTISFFSYYDIGCTMFSTRATKTATSINLRHGDASSSKFPKIRFVRFRTLELAISSAGTCRMIRKLWEIS